MIATILAAMVAVAAPAAEKEVTYALPQTAIALEIRADVKVWRAGKYAAFAEEMLGLEGVCADSVSYTISAVGISSWTEADNASRYSVLLDPKGMEAYAGFCESGNIFMGTTPADDVHISLPSSNSPQPQAEEPAEDPVRLRKEAGEIIKKLEDLESEKYHILTGDTDASYTGDALRAAMDEFKSMEAKLLQPFMTTMETSVQTAHYVIIPKKDAESGSLVFEAFGLSPEKGLVPAGSMDGIPYYIEVDADPVKTLDLTGELDGKCEYQPLVYRVPAICTVRLTGPEGTLSTARMPVWQFGSDEVYPVSIKQLKKSSK